MFSNVLSYLLAHFTHEKAFILGLLSVNYIGFIPHLVEAIKELNGENNFLRSENAGLRTQFVDIGKRLARLERGTSASPLGK